jgi:hypothetical protein
MHLNVFWPLSHVVQPFITIHAHVGANSLDTIGKMLSIVWGI